MQREFRRDIQGLRGLAVGLVVLEHATDFLSGGYIGVDVFFVISGFVITRLMLNEYSSTGSVSLRDFYSRRIRRLIPALTIVLVATLILSLFTLSPGLEQDKAVWAALSSFFFVSNIRYIFEGGYFFLQADPFRHLWSLGVEEQFYAVYPLMFLSVVWLTKKSRRGFRSTFAILLGTVAVISLAMSSMLATGQLLPLATRLSFFGTPFRFWELIAGALVALFVENRSVNLSGGAKMVLEFIGYLAVLWPAITYGPFTLFPGLAALPPVLGVTLLIIIGSTKRAGVSVAETGPLVYLGNISYGLYLWHWPFVVFAKRLFPDSSFAPIVAVVLSVLVADRQLKFVEDPIRHRTDLFGKRALGLLGVSSVITIAVSASLFAGSRSGLGLDSAAQFERVGSVSANCSIVNGELAIAPNCVVERGSEIRILLIGDSQAAAVSDAVVRVADQLGASYRLAFGNSCPVHLRPNELRPDCEQIQKGFPTLAEQFGPSVVIVANASDLYVTRGGFGKPDTRIRRDDGSLPSNYREALENWVAGVRGALESGWLVDYEVVYVHMIPVAPVQSPSLLRPTASTKPFQLSRAFDRNMIVSKERDALSGLENVELIDPAEILCPESECQVATSDGAIYADLFHLNARGALLLAPELKRTIEQMTSR